MKFSTAVLIALFVAVPLHAQITTYWSISENQLPTLEGGRVNSIAIDPEHPNERWAASDSGGLFKSTDFGLHWQHVKTLPVIFTQSVVIIPSRSSLPNVVLVTAKADFKVRNGGGVWRSTDGGATWIQKLYNPNDRISAYEIARQPGTGYIFAGTTKGVASSADGGVSWSYDDAFPAGLDQTIYSVMATATKVYLGGPSGVAVDSIDGNGQRTPVGDPGPIRHMHAFGVWPERRFAFAVNDAGQLHVSADDGEAWSPIATAPPAAGACNGTPFIKAAQRPVELQDRLFLYLSDRCNLQLMSTPVVPEGQQMDFNKPWRQADVDRGAPRDLAFVGKEAEALGTTAGLHRASIPDVTWRLAGGGREGGYNALQINEVKGQIGADRTDLYLGTRDNGIKAWSPPAPSVQSFGSEGHFIELERRVQAGDCNLTFEIGRQTFQSAARLASPPTPFPDHPHRREAPVLLRTAHFAQAVSRLPLPTLGRGMVQSDECGQLVRSFADFREASVGLARLGHAGDENNLTVLYQPYREAGDRLKLMRLERFHTSTGMAARRFPVMTDFESLGINPHMSDLYPVYGVDPVTASHVIAPSIVASGAVGDGKMKFSSNGGGEWFDLADLTTLVQGDPTVRLFQTNLNEQQAGPFPLVTAVSFSPQDPNLVLAGTNEGGIYVSDQNGAPATWSPVSNSGGATYVTAFFWENANTVHVSTFGRGLWKLVNRRISADGPGLCPGCDVVSPDGGSAPLDHGVLIFGGEILGLRTDNRKVREVLVTRGSSVVFIGDPKDLQEDITITESDGRNGSDFESLPKGPDGWIAAGVVFTSEDELTGAAFSKSELSLFQPERVELPADSMDSPTEGAPYLYLNASSYGPREAIELSATDFTAGASYEVLVDGLPVKGTLTADGQGAFSIAIPAPSQTGYHRVSVRMAGDETVIEIATFLVRN